MWGFSIFHFALFFARFTFFLWDCFIVTSRGGHKDRGISSSSSFCIHLRLQLAHSLVIKRIKCDALRLKLNGSSVISSCLLFFAQVWSSDLNAGVLWLPPIYTHVFERGDESLSALRSCKNTIFVRKLSIQL